MNDFEKVRILDQKRRIIEAYDRASQTKQILSFETVVESDGTFTVTYIRPLVDRIWFKASDHYPFYDTLGETVARGEIAHFLSCLKETVKAQTIEGSTFTPEWLGAVIRSLRHERGELSLLASFPDGYYRIMLDEKWNKSYNYETKRFQLKMNGFGIPIYGISKNTMGSDIVILNKECCRVQYVLFHHSDLGIDSTLSVEIKPYEKDKNQTDILVRSTIKIDICRRELAKIFSFKSS